MLKPPLKPMLAKIAEALPEGDGWLYEPKWDGFRAIIFRDGGDVYIQSRDLKPLNRYFPELIDPLRKELPDPCVLDGEIVIAGAQGLDFEALLQRVHPAASRVALLAEQTPASFVAWDLLAERDGDLLSSPQVERRARLEEALARAKPPIFVTPATTDRAVAADWFARFEGAGLDGVIAKRLKDKYYPDKRTMLKIKHARTADCVVGGFRWHKSGPGTLVGSLLLGLYDDRGVLHHVGITSSFTMDRRRELAQELKPLRRGAIENHPWAASLAGDSPRGKGASPAPAPAAENQRLPGEKSRWSAGKDMSWEPLRIERVCEVAYDHLQGDRFRHATVFKRWRPDKPPAACRYDQLEETPPFELSSICIFKPRAKAARSRFVRQSRHGDKRR
jgi:ATP-dependent DNA ligase